MSPTDIELAIEQGCRVLKYFPAETSGGLAHLQNMAAPYQHLGLSFIPLGGLDFDNAGTYLESPLITAIGGSWLAKRPLIQSENWDAITKNARDIKSLIQRSRAKKL
jgi:2-dehydro-3-deoxyphosphogluconate aldolase/(4S)-4-hydroxy-2-oxoglutarate aldolase